MTESHNRHRLSPRPVEVEQGSHARPRVHHIELNSDELVSMLACYTDRGSPGAVPNAKSRYYRFSSALSDPSTGTAPCRIRSLALPGPEGFRVGSGTSSPLTTALNIRPSADVCEVHALMDWDPLITPVRSRVAGLNGVTQQTRRKDRAATESAQLRSLAVAQSERAAKDLLTSRKTSDRSEPEEILA